MIFPPKRPLLKTSRFTSSLLQFVYLFFLLYVLILFYRTNQPPREYVPLESKSAYALLIALYRASQEVPSRPSLSEPELKLDAHNYTMVGMFSIFEILKY